MDTGETKAAPQVKCDQCKKPFGIVLKERSLPGGGVQQWFQCPHCSKYYVVANISAEGAKIRYLIWRTEALLKDAPGDEKLTAELERLRGLLRAEVTKPG